MNACQTAFLLSFFVCCWDVDTCQTFFSDLCLSNIFLGKQLVKHCFKMRTLRLSLFQKVGICQTSFCWVADTCQASFKLPHCYALYTWKMVTVASNPFPYTRSYVQQMQNLVQKLLCEEKQKVLKKQRKKKSWMIRMICPWSRGLTASENDSCLASGAGDRLWRSLCDPRRTKYVRPSIYISREANGGSSSCHHLYMWTLATETPFAHFHPHNVNAYSAWYKTLSCV